MIVPLLIVLIIPLSLHGMDQDKQEEWKEIQPFFVRRALEHANISVHNPRLLPTLGELEMESETANRRRTCSLAPMVQHCYESTIWEATGMSNTEKDAILTLWHNQQPTMAQMRVIECIPNPFLRNYAFHLATEQGCQLVAHSQ